MHTDVPIFILGCPRSGTTLLARLISDLLNYSIVESHFVTKYFHLLKKYGDLNQKNNFKRLFNDILRERPVQEWEITVDIEKAYKEIKSRTLEDITDYISTVRANKFGKQFWGDKTPHYLIDLDVLIRLFPTAKFIRIIRDGRDVSLSLMQKKWGPNNVYACAKSWVIYNTKHDTLFNQLKEEDKLIDILYEKLLVSPKSIMSKLMTFLNVSVSMEKIAELSKLINSQNYNKWKHRLSQKDIQIFESIAGECLQKYGYELINDSPNISSIERFLYALHDKTKWFTWFVYDNTINEFKIRFRGMRPFAD